MAPQSIPRSESVYRHRTHWMDLLAEGSHYTARNLHCQSFTKPSSKGQGLLQGWQCTGENEIIKDFSRITRHWLWTDINSRRPQTSLWPTCQHRGLWRSDNRWRFSSVLSNSGCLTHPVVISPVSERITGTDILINWQNPRITSWMFPI